MVLVVCCCVLDLKPSAEAWDSGPLDKGVWQGGTGLTVNLKYSPLQGPHCAKRLCKSPLHHMWLRRPIASRVRVRC